MKDVWPVAAVIVKVGIGDAGRRRDVIRPSRKLFGNRAVHHNPANTFGLLGHVFIWLIELIGKTFAVFIDQDTAFAI